MFFVYILRSVSSGAFYVGHTEDLVQRIREHETGRSHYTKGRGPWELVYVEVFPTRAEAMNRESQIKQRKSKRYIEKLIEQNQGDWRKLAGMKDSEVG
jgi:putative endonuclease